MALPKGLKDWLAENDDAVSQDGVSVAGGCINDSRQLETQNGRMLFIKQNPQAPEDMFAAEARSLELLAKTDTLRVPRVHYVDSECLVLEFLEPAAPARDYWEAFGRGLAAMHRHTSDRFGLDFDNYCGLTHQSNSPTADGYRFFADSRLRWQAHMARERGFLQQSDLQAVERLCERLPELIPPQPASLLHGDLWSGNAHVGPLGEPVLIDPAIYYGWREAELGMTTLFGGFPESFYQAYAAAWPLEPGWRERLPVYNLYHLLNHLNLFGAGYLNSVRAVLNRYK